MARKAETYTPMAPRRILSTCSLVTSPEGTRQRDRRCTVLSDAYSVEDCFTGCVLGFCRHDHLRRRPAAFTCWRRGRAAATPTGAKRYSRQTRHLLGFVRPPAHGYSCNETRIRHPAKLLRVHLQLVGCERRL